MELKSSEYPKMFLCKTLKLNLEVMIHLNDNSHCPFAVMIFFFICFLLSCIVTTEQCW